jgi:glycosyltransferase involved in cell wall biosynthesis
VIDIAYEAGGAEISVTLIRDQLRAQGHTVQVLSTTKNASDKTVFADILIPAIGGPAPLRLARYAWYPAAYRQMRRTIRDFRPDLIHLHTISEFSPALVWAIRRVPTVLTVHGPEEFTRELLPWLQPASDYRHGRFNARDRRLVGRLRYAYLRWWQRPLYLAALRRLRLVIAPSRYMAQAVQPDFPRTPIVQLYNGVSLPQAAELPQTGAPTVLYLGRLEAVKGVDHLVAAWAAIHQTVPTARLRIVGDGAARSDLEAQAQRLGSADSIEFTGWVPQAHIAEQYAAATLVVVPSVWPENLPTVAIEALAVGRPLVGSDTGGISELIEAGVNGCLVPPGDERALAEGIISLLNNPVRLDQAARAATAKARQFEIATFTDRLLQLYSEILK